MTINETLLGKTNADRDVTSYTWTNYRRKENWVERGRQNEDYEDDKKKRI